MEKAGKGKERHKLAQQPVRHSLWEQESLEAQNEVLSGLPEDEVRALRQRRADYDEARRLSEGSDSCWSDPADDSGSESAPELDTGLPALEGAEEVGAEVVGEEKVTLQHQGRATAVARKRVQREEQPGGTKRRGGQWGEGHAGGKKRWQRQRRASQRQTGGKWHLDEFGTSPGGTKPVAGNYAVGAFFDACDSPAALERLVVCGERGTGGSILWTRRKNTEGRALN